ncbi:hypothetical protein N2152v2_008549 [Parachlorella kessleri]
MAHTRTALPSATLEELLEQYCLTSHTLRILVGSGLASLEDAHRSLNLEGCYLVESGVLFPLLLDLAISACVGLLTAIVLWTVHLPWRVSCLALRLPLWLNDVIWGLPFWVLGTLRRLAGRAVPPRASAVIQKALEDGLAAVFMAVQRARTTAAAAVRALRRASVSEVTPVPEEASHLRSSHKDTQPALGQQPCLGGTSNAATAGDLPVENNSSNHQRAHKQVGTDKASELLKKPGGGKADTPAVAAEVRAAARSSCEGVARGAALAAPSGTPEVTGPGDDGQAGTANPTTAQPTQQAQQETQLVPQPIPLPAGAAPPSQPTDALSVVSDMRRRGRAGRAGNQARVSVERVPPEHEAPQGPVSRSATPKDAQPPPEAEAAAAVQYPSARAAPLTATSSSGGSRAGQQLLAALQASAPQAESHALATQQGQGSRARYNPLLSTSSSGGGSVAPISSQQHDMVSSQPAPWLPGEQATEAALPWPAAAVAPSPPIASLQPQSPAGWPGASAPPPLFASPFIPPAAASVATPAVADVTSQPSPPVIGGIPSAAPAAAAESQQAAAGAFGSTVQQAGLGPAAAPASAAALTGSTGLPPGQVLQHPMPMPIPLPAAAANPEGSVHSSHAGDLTAAEAECVLCWDAARETTLAPCGHRALCVPCTELVEKFYRHMLASYLLKEQEEDIAADLAVDAAAGFLGYRQVFLWHDNRWSDFTQLVYRVQHLKKDWEDPEPHKDLQRACVDELSVLRRLFDSGLVTLPGLLEYYDADLRDRWLHSMSGWYQQSAAHRLADAGQMEVVETLNAAGQREALVLWALPMSFRGPSSMMWSHTLDLYSFDGFHGWRLVVEFRGGCMTVGLLPDRPPWRDHTLVAIYRLLVVDEHGESLASSCETEPSAQRTHYVRAAKGTRQPIMLPWEQCIPFPPATPDALPARGELVVAVVLQDATVAAAACEKKRCELEDFVARLPTASELVLRPNAYYRHAPSEFLTAWGLPPGSPGFVRSATLDSQALHEAWGLIRGGPGQRTFWVPGDPQLPPPPPWGRAAGEGSIENDDSSCGADGATGGSDSDEEGCYCDDECVEESDDGSVWYEPPLEEIAEAPRRSLAAAAPAAELADGIVQHYSQPASLQPSRSLVDFAPRCTPPRVKALLAEKAATREAAAWDWEHKSGYVLAQVLRVDLGEAVAMAWCWLQAEISPQVRAMLGETFFGLLTAIGLWTLQLPWRLSCLALRLPLWLNDIIWGLPFWILGTLGRLAGRAVPPRASAVLQKALVDGLAEAFVAVRQTRTAAAGAVHALRRGTSARAPPTAQKDNSGKNQSHTGGSAKGRTSSGRRGRGQGKASSRHRQYQQAPAQHSATVPEVNPIPGESSDSRKSQEDTQPATTQQQHVASTSSAGTAGDLLIENSSRYHQPANEQVGTAKASEWPWMPGGGKADTPAAAGAVRAAPGSSGEGVARCAALAAPSATPQIAGPVDDGQAGMTNPTTAHAQHAAEESQLVPQPIPLPAAAAPPSQTADDPAVVPNMRRRGRAGRAGSQARVSVERVRPEHGAHQTCAARDTTTEGAQPSAEAGAVAALQQPSARAASAATTTSSSGSRAGQHLLAALQAAAPQQESQALVTQQSQGSRARYHPLLGISNSGSSVGPITSQQQDMIPSQPAPWLPGEQGTEADRLPWTAAAAAPPPPVASLQPESPAGWPGASAQPPSFASPFFPPAAARPAVAGVASQPSLPDLIGMPSSAAPAAAAGSWQAAAGAFGSTVQQAGLGPAAAPASAAALTGSTGLPPGQVLQHPMPMPIPLPAAAANPEGSVHSSHAGDLTAAEAECVLCWDAARETTLAPCGHRALCLPCTELWPMMKAVVIAAVAVALLALDATAQPSGSNKGLPPSAYATGLAPQKLAALAVEQIQCLEATFDSFAAWGQGMNPQNFGNGPAPIGGRKANLSAEILPWVEEVAHNEIGHVRLLREALGAAALPCPLVNIDQAFQELFNLAFGTTNVKWDPYKNDVNSMLSMFALEEIGATGDQGAIAFAAINGNLTYVNIFGGFAGSAYGQSSADRHILWERRNDWVPEFNVSVAQAFDRLSALRDTLDGAVKIDQPVEYLGGINLVQNDGNGVTLSRTPQQVLNMLALGSGTGKGGFFPSGVNGRINTPVPLDPSVPPELLAQANAQPVIVPGGSESKVLPLELPAADMSRVLGAVMG